jgi:hypothetical protein
MYPDDEVWLECGEHDVQIQEHPGRFLLAPMHLLSRLRRPAPLTVSRGTCATEVAQ